MEKFYSENDAGVIQDSYMSNEGKVVTSYSQDITKLLEESFKTSIINTC